MRRIEELVKQIVNKAGMKDDLYEVDKEAARRGHKVLRLPPYQCDLNVIEFCWKIIKHEIRKKNAHQNLKEVKQIAENVLNSFGKEQIAPFWEHVKHLEQRYWEEDGWFDTAMTQTPVIITQEDEDDIDNELEEDDIDNELEEDDIDNELEEDDIDEDFDEDDLETCVSPTRNLYDCNVMEDPQFQYEAEIGRYMYEQATPAAPKRRKTCSKKLFHQPQSGSQDGSSGAGTSTGGKT